MSFDPHGGGNRFTRKENRQAKRAIRAAKYAIVNANGGGEKEKARRIDQMLREVARAENGVIINYAEEQANEGLPKSGEVLDTASSGVPVSDTGAYTGYIE
jgi:hypothetical protein